VRLTSSSVGAIGLTVLASAYWLIPLFKGTNQEGRELSGIGAFDLAAFRTVPDQHLGLLANVLGLYGFWAEGVQRFPSMKEFVPFWPAILIGLLALGGIGVWANLARPDIAFEGARPWVLALLATGGVDVLLDMGHADPHIKPMVQWL